MRDNVLDLSGLDMGIDPHLEEESLGQNPNRAVIFSLLSLFSLFFLL